MVKLYDAAPKNPSHALNRKNFARRLFADTVKAVALKPIMSSQVSLKQRDLLIGSNCFPLELFSHVLVIAVGKAAIPMAEHVHQVLTPYIADGHKVEGIVVGSGAWTAPPGWTYFEGAHPIPDTNSFASAELLLQHMHAADENTLVVFLISGGASSMVESPLSPLITEQDIIVFYRSLLHAGLPIEKMNALRKHLSAVKGGRLAAASSRATKASLLISDVPTGMLHVVGSGLSLADPTTVEDCRRILEETTGLMQAFPESIRSFFSVLPETPKEIPAGKLPSTCDSLLSSESLTEAASELATAHGYRVLIDNTCDDWDYCDAAQYLVDRIRAERKRGGRICLLSAGEVTVSITGKAGIGGRNQQWTLETARLLQHEDTDYVVLSAGSDGIDGNSPAAGAVADTQTWTRAEMLGLDPQQALTTFDTYALFEQLQDTIITGPLGNNLRDLRIILAD
jgi:glycerate 2-kinase